VEVKDKNELCRHCEELRNQTSGDEAIQINNTKTFIPSGTKLNLSEYRNFVSFDTRSREIRNNLKSEEAFPTVRCYPTTNGLQLFISFEDEFGYLYGFTRLQLGNNQTEMEYS
jgi:hypothetical protein